MTKKKKVHSEKQPDPRVLQLQFHHARVVDKFSIPLLRERCLSPLPLLMRKLGGEIIGKKGEQHAFKDNGSSVLAVAHTDVVLEHPHFVDTDLTEEHRIYNTSLDDRLGVYTIMDLLPALGITTDILLTQNEERGHSTGADFTPPRQYNWIVEFDRRGEDVVLYQYWEMESAAKRHFRVDRGTFSDISQMGHLKCLAMNVGVGYDNEHFFDCHMDVDAYLRQITRFILFHEEYQNVPMPYKEREFDTGTLWAGNSTDLGPSICYHKDLDCHCLYCGSELFYFLYDKQLGVFSCGECGEELDEPQAIKAELAVKAIDRQLRVL